MVPGAPVSVPPARVRIALRERPRLGRRLQLEVLGHAAGRSPRTPAPRPAGRPPGPAARAGAAARPRRPASARVRGAPIAPPRPPVPRAPLAPSGASRPPTAWRRSRSRCRSSQSWNSLDGALHVESVEERTAVERRWRAPASPAWSARSSSVASHQSASSGTAISSSPRPARTSAPSALAEEMQRAAEGGARVALVEVGPEEGEEGVAPVEAAGRVGGEVGEECEPFRLLEHGAAPPGRPRPGGPARRECAARSWRGER